MSRMASSRSKGRRVFLKQIPAALAAGLAAPAMLATETQAQTGPSAPAQNGGLTAANLAAAQQVAGVSLPPAELETARPLVAANLRNINLVRNVPLAPEIEPAFPYRPPRPKPAPRTIRPRARRRSPVHAPQVWKTWRSSP